MNENELALKEQHRNTRHDAVDVLNDTIEEWSNKGYTFPKEFVDTLAGRIINLKQRSPKEGKRLLMEEKGNKVVSDNRTTAMNSISVTRPDGMVDKIPLENVYCSTTLSSYVLKNNPNIIDGVVKVVKTSNSDKTKEERIYENPAFGVA